MFTLMPPSVSCLHAARPSGVVGHFTSTLGAHSAYRLPSATIPSVSVETHSIETVPDATMLAILRMAPSASAWPARASNDGLVVTPPSTPRRAASSIWPMSAVSR